MGSPHTSLESVLLRVLAAEKYHGCNLRPFVFTSLQSELTDRLFLESFRDKLALSEEYEWCASVQQLINGMQLSAEPTVQITQPNRK